MNDFFLDPAWKMSSLLAAAFGGFLTVWIGKLARWVTKQFSKENRDQWRQAKSSLEAEREKVYEEMVRNPMLIVLNTLHIALIFVLVISSAWLIAALPALAEGARYSATVARQTLCPSSNVILSAFCKLQPALQDSPISDEKLVCYYWIAAPALFCYLMFFFAWFWAAIFKLFRAYHRALGGYNIASPRF